MTFWKKKSVQFPNSIIEKRKKFKEESRLERWMYVHELILLLQKFNPDDWVEINNVGNLVILQEDVPGFWVIDMGSSILEDYTKVEE